MKENILLYHGTSVGWLNISGFDAPSFKYGELSGEDYFIYLCTEKYGAVSAAYKACSQVKSRHNWEKPCLTPYFYSGVQYDFRPYVYEISFPEEIRTLDFYKFSLNKEEIHKIKLAIVYARTRRISREKRLRLKVSRWWEWRRLSIELNRNPGIWGDVLHEAFDSNRRKKLCYLSYFGFDLFRNIERDGDGQGYGEVWGLSSRAYRLAKISPPEALTLY